MHSNNQLSYLPLVPYQPWLLNSTYSTQQRPFPISVAGLYASYLVAHDFPSTGAVLAVSKMPQLPGPAKSDQYKRRHDIYLAPLELLSMVSLACIWSWRGP